VRIAVSGFGSPWTASPFFDEQKGDMPMPFLLKGLAGANDCLTQRMWALEDMLSEYRITEADHAELTVKAFQEFAGMETLNPALNKPLGCPQCGGDCDMQQTGLCDKDSLYIHDAPLAKFRYNGGVVKVWLGEARRIISPETLLLRVFRLKVYFVRSGRDEMSWTVSIPFQTCHTTHEQLVHNGVKHLPGINPRSTLSVFRRRQNVEDWLFVKRWVTALLRPDNIPAALRTEAFLAMLELQQNTLSLHKFEELSTKTTALTDEELATFEEGYSVLQEGIIQRAKKGFHPNVVKLKDLLEKALPRLEPGLNMDNGRIRCACRKLWIWRKSCAIC
jgi:hypothetical protein